MLPAAPGPSRKHVLASDEDGACRIRVIDPEQVITAADSRTRVVSSEDSLALRLAKATEVVATAVEVLQNFQDRPDINAEMLGSMVLAVADHVILSERFQPAPRDSYESGSVVTLSAKCDVEMKVYADAVTGAARWKVSASQEVPDPTFPLNWSWLANNVQGLGVSIYDIDGVVDALTNEGSKAALDMARQLRPFREDRWKWASLVMRNLSPAAAN